MSIHQRPTAGWSYSPRVEVQALKKSLLYSEDLGIDLEQRHEGEYFKWFLASLLFGARVSESIA
jgi:hypothetical protein